MTRRIMLAALSALGLAPFLPGCATEQQKEREFFTSGNHEADQRADQRMAKAQQLSGGGSPSLGQRKKSLYERLGSESGIRAIVVDWVPRLLNDPRVNFQRKGVIYGGFGLHRNKSMYWEATPDKIKSLDEHMVQFLALATGGPSQYQGREMGPAHYKMHISNPEFDAGIGDLKVTLDKIQVPVDDQKELLSIVESTREQIVEER